MERDDRLDALVEQCPPERDVVADRRGRPLALLRFDAAPFDREAVAREPEVTHQRDVVGPAVPRVARITARLGAPRTAGVLPLPPVVVPVPAFDLVGRGGRPPREAVGKRPRRLRHSGSPMRAKHSSTLRAHEPSAQLGVEIVERGTVQLDRVGVALLVGIVGRPHDDVGDLGEHVERVDVAEPGQRGDPHVAPQHVAAGHLPRPVAQRGRRHRLALEHLQERRHPVDAHLLEHHGERGVTGEHAAVQQCRQQVLRRVDALRVRQTRETGDAGAVGQVPSDVGPAGEVGFGVADVDDRDHPEARRRGPQRVPPTDDRARCRRQADPARSTGRTRGHRAPAPVPALRPRRRGRRSRRPRPGAGGRTPTPTPRRGSRCTGAHPRRGRPRGIRAAASTRRGSPGSGRSRCGPSNRRAPRATTRATGAG